MSMHAPPALPAHVLRRMVSLGFPSIGLGVRGSTADYARLSESGASAQETRAPTDGGDLLTPISFGEPAVDTLDIRAQAVVLFLFCLKY
jgi:hypothetical protein